MMSDDEVDKSGRDIFSRTEADHLTHHCRSVVKNGPISVERIRDILSQTTLGKKILNKFAIQQIQSRIKYERRKLQLKTKCQ